MRHLSTYLLQALAMLAGVFVSALVHAQTWQPVDSIRAAAIAALQADASAQAMVAPGLRLAACTQALSATPSGAATAQVRCADTPGWRLYVPVRRKSAKKVPAPAAGIPTAASTVAPALPVADPLPPAVTVKRGDPVVLRAAMGGIEIRMGGRALGPAIAGATVNVENESSHRIVRGRLGPDGTVEVVN